MRRLILLALALCAATPAFAGTGIFQTYVVLDRGAGNVFFEGSGPDNNTVNPLFQTFYFTPTPQTTTAFILRGAQIKTFKNGTGNVLGAQLFYRVYAQGAAAPAFTEFGLGFQSNDGNGDQTWQSTTAGVNLAAACGTGNVCTLEVFFRATTNEGDRFDNNGGANYARPFGVAPFLDPVLDRPGYRLLSPPSTGTTVGGLATINLVQGVAAGTINTQQQYPTASPNIFLRYDGTSNGFGGYVRPASVDVVVEPGRGFFWQWYDIQTVASGTTAGGGTSFSRELSVFTLPSFQNFPSASLSLGGFVANGAVGASGFYMVGNPFAYPLNASGITADQPLQTTFQAWLPSGTGTSGTYQPILAGQFLARWQGVFAEVSSATATAPTFTFNALVTSATPPQGPFYRDGAVPYVQLVLSGATAAGASVTDEAAFVRFLPDALVGWDPNDASKLLPPGGPFALIAPVGERDGAPYRTAVNSLPVDGQMRTVAVAFRATDAGTYTLAWNGAEALPEGWSATLRDVVSGEVTDLRAATSYPFTSAATDWTSRFELVLTPDGAVAGETGAPATGLRVLAPRPNPARGTAEVAVELGEAQHVRAALYDALGRRVLTVTDAAAPAGTLALRLDVGRLAPGVYVLRVEGAASTASQTVTVVR